MDEVKPIAGTVYFKKLTEFDLQLLRAFAYDKDFGPSYGLSISTAMKITEGDFDSWYEQWKASGDKVSASAEESNRKGFNESAKRDYLIASVCYRTADFFLRQNLNDTRIIPLADLQRDTFRKGFSKFDFGIKILKIPYEKTTLDGYLFTSDKSGKAKPTLIYIGGYDSFVEETFYAGAHQALIRGYNVLTYDGPGQGQVLRRQKLYLRPDWEKVNGPVLDFAETLPEIDKNKIILLGRSFAGYFSPRAACFDPRPAVLVVDSALYDLGLAIKNVLSPELSQLLLDKKDDELNKAFEPVMSDPLKGYYFKSRMSVHGARSVVEFFRMLSSYSLEGIAQNIKMPAFICAGEYDPSGPQSQMLYDNICSKDKTLTLFKGEDGAGDHCEFANQDIFYTAMFNWLDERFK